jgi:hypothetical protein
MESRLVNGDQWPYNILGKQRQLVATCRARRLLRAHVVSKRFLDDLGDRRRRIYRFSYLP